MPSPCCTNCRKKYSLINPEEGCSNCALSFCRKCLPHRAILPHLANKPVTVCSQCYEKLNAQTLRNQSANGTQITRIVIGDVPETSHSSYSISGKPGNWWGDGLPPPSMRQSAGASRDVPLPIKRILHETTCSHSKSSEMEGKEEDLVKRFEKSRQEDEVGQPLTLSQIEERLAALRGCDVELIRRPRCMFEAQAVQSPSGNLVQDLIEMAKERVDIEDRHDPFKELQRRHRALKKDDGESFSPQQENRLYTPGNENACDQNNLRLSTVSSSTAFSEATKKELDEINRLLADAQMSVHSNPIDDETMRKEMKNVIAATRQKSLEIEKMSDELGHFWDRQFDKVLSSSDESVEESVDDETVKKIILEAEQTIEDSDEDKTKHGSSTSFGGNLFSKSQPTSSSSGQLSSPKKSSLFSKIFHR